LIAFADTSFLCALYREEEGHSAVADALMVKRRTPFFISSLVLLEFRQSARLQAFRFSHHHAQGYPLELAQRMIRMLEQNVAAGAIGVASVDWTQIHAQAEKLSFKHTPVLGVRMVDLIHVATALSLSAREFLSFDEQQKKVARKEGLRVPA
jgi:predicted nucleic acid-binding protein